MKRLINRLIEWWQCRENMITDDEATDLYDALYSLYTKGVARFRDDEDPDTVIPFYMALVESHELLTKMGEVHLPHPNPLIDTQAVS
jgi:hypothetical protein